ncbi:uncharacterized protein [Miscanthus floridulus]|uniref:uncharacterized protein n=1 Tax=Miscanthus floridulus TaxID=154761 RepID=UPI003457B51E
MILLYNLYIKNSNDFSKKKKKKEKVKGIFNSPLAPPAEAAATSPRIATAIRSSIVWSRLLVSASVGISFLSSLSANFYSFCCFSSESGRSNIYASFCFCFCFRKLLSPSSLSSSLPPSLPTRSSPRPPPLPRPRPRLPFLSLSLSLSTDVAVSRPALGAVAITRRALAARRHPRAAAHRTASAPVVAVPGHGAPRVGRAGGRRSASPRCCLLTPVCVCSSVSRSPSSRGFTTRGLSWSGHGLPCFHVMDTSSVG